MTSIGENIRINRINNAWSQEDLANKLGVTQKTVSNWENNKGIPEDKKKKVFEILGLVQAGSSLSGQQGLVEQTEIGPSAFGSWVNRIRLERDMSVPELAHKAGLSAPAIYNIESGKALNPRSETVRNIEKALGEKVPRETKSEISKEADVEGLGELIDFQPLVKEDWPDVAGIYVLYDISERPIYVGQGGSIKRRLQDHEEKFWFKAPIVMTGAYINIQEEGLRKKIEAILIRFLKKNAVINKQLVNR